MAKRSLNRPFKGLDKRLAREQAEREKQERERQEQLERERQEREKQAKLERERQEQLERELQAKLERERQAQLEREQQAKLGRTRQTRLESAQQAQGQEREQPTPPPGSFAALAESSSITPLPQERARVPREPQREVAAFTTPPPTAPTERYEIEQHKGYIEGRRIDVDPAVVEQLRHARPPGRLDLHGLQAELARRTLQRFVLGRYAQGQRDLLVIVGKGKHSPRREAVLRSEVAHWLSEPKMAPFVLAFVTARDEHGGHGALYVRLSTYTR